MYLKLLKKAKAAAEAVRHWRGLGDAVHSLFGDGLVARLAEFVAQDLLHLESCGCIKRKSRLNSAVPFRPATLAVCIPHRNDLEGVWATLQSIRDEFLSTPHIRYMGVKYATRDLLSVVIVNQKTGHTAGNIQMIDAQSVASQLEGFARAISNCGLRVSVTHQPPPHGSAPAKQACAAQAAKEGAEWCMICDAHVHFVPRALIQTLKWIQRSKNRNSRDLYYGFLVNDHMTPRIRRGRLESANGYTSINPWDKAGNPHIGGDNLWGRWSDAVIYAHALQSALPEDLRSLVPAKLGGEHSFFVPVCLPRVARKVEAIVGANLRIPECPDAGWLLAAIAQMLSQKKDDAFILSNARRQHIVKGLVGLMTDRWPEHFDIHGSGGWLLLTRVDQAVRSLDGVNQQSRHMQLYLPEMQGFGGEESIVGMCRRENGHAVKCLPHMAAYHRFMRTWMRQTYGGSWHDAARNHMIAAHKLHESLAPAMSQNPKAILASDLFVRAYIAAGRSPEEVLTAQAKAIAELRGIEAEAAKATPTTSPTAGTVSSMASLHEKFTALKAEASDINEHLQTLFDLAYQFEHVSEFGTRYGTSTTAMLAAQPKTLISYDTQKSCPCKGLEKIKGATDLQFRQGPEFDTAAMPVIEGTDILLVDTLHTAEHVFAELSKHAVAVRHVIVLHDTEAPWGSQDERGGSGGGVRAGIAKWLATSEGSNWQLEAEYKNNHGLHVYRRKKI
jgi:hypothetical protein